MSDANRTYARRDFVIYRDVVETRSGGSQSEILAAYLRNHPDADLDQPMTFAQWLAEEEGAGSVPA